MIITCPLCGIRYAPGEEQTHIFRLPSLAYKHGYTWYVGKRGAFPREAVLLDKDSRNILAPTWMKEKLQALSAVERLSSISPPYSVKDAGQKLWLTRFYEDSEALAVSDAMFESLGLSLEDLKGLSTPPGFLVWGEQVAELLSLPPYWRMWKL